MYKYILKKKAQRRIWKCRLHNWTFAASSHEVLNSMFFLLFSLSFPLVFSELFREHTDNQSNPKMLYLPIFVFTFKKPSKIRFYFIFLFCTDAISIRVRLHNDFSMYYVLLKNGKRQQRRQFSTVGFSIYEADEEKVSDEKIKKVKRFSSISLAFYCVTHRKWISLCTRKN